MKSKNQIKKICRKIRQLKFPNETHYSHFDHTSIKLDCGGVVILKTGRREVPGSNTGCACNLAVQSFLWLSCKYGLGSLRKTSTEGIPPIVPGPTSGQLDSKLLPTYLDYGIFSTLLCFLSRFVS